MKEYEKEPFDELTDEQLDELLALTEHSMTEESQESIKNRVHQIIQKEELTQQPIELKKKKSKWKYILGIAAGFCLLVGFTNRDVIMSMYQKAFGKDAAELSFNADELDESVEDNGLKLTAKSSFKDGNTTYVLMTLQDLTGDRLDKETDIYEWEMLGGGNTKVIDYDASTKTATLLTSAVNWDNHENKGFKLTTFRSQPYDFETSTVIDWKKAIQDNPTWVKHPLEGGMGGGYKEEELEKLNITFEDLYKTHLEPNLLHLPLNEEDTVVVENIAYKDGLLHILAKGPNDLYHDNFNLELVSKKNHKEKGFVAAFQAVEETHNNETGRSDYYETVFNIPESEIENYDLKMEAGGYKEVVKGNWAIKLKEPSELEKKSLGEFQLDNNITLSNLVLSGLSFKFDYNPKEVKEELPLDIRIVQTDGTEHDVSNGLVELHSSSETKDDWSIIYDYIPLETISKLIINGKTIDVK